VPCMKVDIIEFILEKSSYKNKYTLDKLVKIQ